MTAQITLVFAGDDIQEAQHALTPFLNVGPIMGKRIELLSYHMVVVPPENHHHGQGLGNTRSGLLEHMTPPAVTVIESMMKSGDVMIMQFRSMGGAVHDVPKEAMAWSHRSQQFSVVAATASSHTTRMNAYWAQLYPHLNGMYPSFETDTDPARLLDAFPEPVLSRLRALKAKWDPDNVFNRNFSIPPAQPSGDTTHHGGADFAVPNS